MTAPDPSAHTPEQARSGIFKLALVPLVTFGLLSAVFGYQLMSGRDASTVPSVLIGKAAPNLPLAPIEGLATPTIDLAAAAGKVVIVNVWASWCVPCRDEHPLLAGLADRDGVVLAGINYKDKPEQARAFLSELGNPFAMIGADANGRAAIEWGVYGVPETFIVGRDGMIAYKHVGPLTPSMIADGPFGRALDAALSDG